MVLNGHIKNGLIQMLTRVECPLPALEGGFAFGFLFRYGEAIGRRHHQRVGGLKFGFEWEQNQRVVLLSFNLFPDAAVPKLTTTPQEQ